MRDGRSAAAPLDQAAEVGDHILRSIPTVFNPGTALLVVQEPASADQADRRQAPGCISHTILAPSWRAECIYRIRPTGPSFCPTMPERLRPRMLPGSSGMAGLERLPTWRPAPHRRQLLPSRGSSEVHGLSFFQRSAAANMTLLSAEAGPVPTEACRPSPVFVAAADCPTVWLGAAARRDRLTHQFEPTGRSSMSCSGSRVFRMRFSTPVLRGAGRDCCLGRRSGGRRSARGQIQHCQKGADTITTMCPSRSFAIIAACLASLFV